MYLRPYQSSDLDAIFAMDRLCFGPRFRFSRAMMRRVIGAPGAVVRLACHAGANGTEVLLGFCAAQVEDGGGDRHWGYVSTLDVAPESRRRGVAQALMHAAESEVARAGADCMLLHVYVENLPAVKLYEGLGYARGGREADFYGEGFDAWAYRKDLLSLPRT